MGEIKPIIVDVTDGARDKFRALKVFAEQRRIEEAQAGTGLDALYARIHEHSVKLALVGHDTRQITGATAAWACELMMHLSSRVVHIARTQIGNNDYERDLMAVANFIADFDNGVSKKPIYRKFQRIPLQELNKILHHLSENGTIDVEEKISAANGRPMQSFRCT